MKTKNPVKQPLAGFTLLEVLISVLVLSVGLLGLAGLQATGMKTNHSAYMRSQAVSYGYDILDRMRANRLSALSGTYNIAMGAGAPAGTSIAQTDLREWKALIAGQLPSGDASANVNGGTVTVVVQWDDSRADGSNTETIT
ncbi:MAG: type IV pilus modification protein PilV, partial [Thiogranum sp.]